MSTWASDLGVVAGGAAQIIGATRRPPRQTSQTFVQGGSADSGVPVWLALGGVVLFLLIGGAGLFLLSRRS